MPQTNRRLSPFIPACFALATLLLAASTAHAVWLDNAWPVRRPVDVGDAETSATVELAEIQFYTLGLHNSSGLNIRVAGEDGKPVPARVLMMGPGDKMRVLFQPARGVRRYYVYFGNPKPPPAPKSLDDFPIRCGILLEMRKRIGPLAQDYNQIVQSWDAATVPIGQMMLPRLFLGYNPFNDQTQIISKYTATLHAPADGEYAFAASTAQRGELVIDGKGLLFVPSNPGDTRFNARIDLKRGNHDLVFYHQSNAQERISVVWKRPNSPAYELIPTAAFGIMPRVSVAPLQQLGKTLVADMTIDYQGECFFADHYSHRYRFTAFMPPDLVRAAITYSWDFGDGQTATGPSVDHVFLTDTEYPVKLTAKFGLQTDIRTNRLAVSRWYERIDNPPGNLPPTQAKIVSTYDMARLPPRSLPWAVLLLHRAKDAAGLEKAAVSLAAITQAANPAEATAALAAAADELSSLGRFDAAAHIWDAVPFNSPFQPFAARRYAQLLLWRIGDFDTAVKILEPHAHARPQDRELQRIYAQALVLAQNPAAGIRILQALPPEGPLDRQAALSGAMARTIEFYIAQNDSESGAAAWDKWQQQYPADFLQGYSILLQVELMEKAKAPLAAARVAEAFALAIPKSSYAPTLLDRASKLLARADPARSRALRNLLKQKYPEDPLSQDTPIK